MTQETKTRGNLDLTFTGQVVLKRVKDNKTLRMLGFRVRAQNMEPPAEWVLSLHGLPMTLKTLAPEPEYIDGQWVHFAMKPEVLAAHPELFENTESPAYLDPHLDLILDLEQYEALLPGALAG